MKLYAPIIGVKTHLPASPALDVSPGDVILIKGHSFYDTLIREAQSLRFIAPHYFYTHAAIITHSDKNIAEAGGRMVTIGSLEKYTNYEYVVIRMDLADSQRVDCIRFVDEAMNEVYGWTTIVSVGLNLITGGVFDFGLSGQEMCSGFVAKALEHAGFIFPNDASHISPAELASYFMS